MSDPLEELTSPVCPNCGGALRKPQLTQCWLCHADLPSGGEHLVQKVPSPPADRISFSLGTLMLLVTLASVCLGLMVFSRGLGIFACILLIPVLARTARVVRARELAGDAVSPAEKVALTTTSFGVATLIVILAWFATCCSMCGTLLTIISVGSYPQGRTDVSAVVLSVSILLLGIAAGLALIKLLKWNHKRYERDIHPHSGEDGTAEDAESAEEE